MRWVVLIYKGRSFVLQIDELDYPKAYKKSFRITPDENTYEATVRVAYNLFELGDIPIAHEDEWMEE